LLRVGAEGRLEGFTEGYGFCGNGVHVRPALHAREESAIQERAHFFEFAARGAFPERVLKVLPHQDKPSARATQGFVGSAGNHVTVREGVVKQAGCDEARWVSNVRNQEGTYFVGDVPQGLPVPISRVAAGPCHEHLGAETARHVSNLVVIQPVGIWPNPIVLHKVEFTRGVEGAAVGEVSAVRQLKAQEFFAGFQQGQEYGFVGLGPRMRLHISPDRPKEGFDSLLSQPFHFIYVLAPSVVAPTGEALGVLIREDGT